MKTKRKSRATWLAIEIPCALNFEDAGDDQLDDDVAYMTGADNVQGDVEMNHPEPLRIDANNISRMLFDCTNWEALREQYCERHTEVFSQHAGDDLGFAANEDLALRHLSGTTAEIKLSIAKRLIRHSRRDKHETFFRIVEERGWRSNETGEELLAMPLLQWTSDQLGWLLQACLKLGKLVPLPGLSAFEIAMRKAVKGPWQHLVPSNQSARDENIFSSVYEDEYSAWQDNVDWTKFKAKRAEKREELRADWDEQHPNERVLEDCYRCPLTIELQFAA